MNAFSRRGSNDVLDRCLRPGIALVGRRRGVEVSGRRLCRAVGWGRGRGHSPAGAGPGGGAEAGAIATQALANLSYGPNGLELLRSGLSAEETVARLTGDDPLAGRRQLAVVA